LPLLITSGLARVLLGLILAGNVAIVPGPLQAAAQADTAKLPVQERLSRVRANLFSRPDKAQESIRELKAILAVDPRSAEGHLLLGIAYRSVGAADLMGETVAEFRQALALNPDFVPARFYLANVYLELGRAARAREELELALTKAPGQTQFLALLGEAERQLGNPRRAVEVARQALQPDPSFAQARYYLGLALLDLGQRAEAIQELERVAQSGAKMVEVHINLGTAYLDANRPDDALETLLQGRQLDPARPEIRILLSRAYRSKGLLAKADEQLKFSMPDQGVTAASPVFQQVQSDLYLEQGLLRLQQRQLEAAASALQKLLRIDANHGPGNRAMAEVYLLQGSYSLALDHEARAEKLGFPLPEDKRKLLQDKRPAKGTGGRP
jgi:tetratricopeptide (TPR) repeat protein